MGSKEQDKRKRVTLRFLKPNGDCIRGLEIDEPFDNNFNSVFHSKLYANTKTS